MCGIVYTLHIHRVKIVQGLLFFSRNICIYQQRFWKKKLWTLLQFNDSKNHRYCLFIFSGSPHHQSGQSTKNTLFSNMFFLMSFLLNFRPLLVHFREATHKKSFFLLVGPLRFYPPYTNFREKSVFLLSGQGGLPSLHP